MSQEGREYLSTIMDSVICIPDAFRISFGADKFVFSVMGEDTTTNEYFAVSAIYDSICYADEKIKYAFEQALACDFSDTIKDYDPFSKPKKQEINAKMQCPNTINCTGVLGGT